MTKMRAKFKGFCSKCHFTIWKNEEIFFNGNAWHVDCRKAINDPTPRTLDNQYIKVLGKIKKSEIKKLLAKS